MYTPRSRGGLGVVHSTPLNRQPDVPTKILLFIGPGYQLNGTTYIKRGPYTWNIYPLLTNKDDRMSIDICIYVSGIPPGTYLRTQFTLQQPGNVKQTFEFTFDKERKTFFYRRALTIPKVINKDGEVGCHYSHYRFLRSREDDEPLVVHDDDEQVPWKPRIPYVWERKNGAWRWTDTNDMFLENIGRLERHKNSFLYYFFIEHMVPLDEPPPRRAEYWPKHTQSFKWKFGKEFYVDANWFVSWKSFKTFASVAHTLTSEEFDDLYDVLGHYYHDWRFKDARLVELVQIAEKFGFYDFPQVRHTDGHFKSFTNSLKSISAYSYLHPIHLPKFQPSIGVKPTARMVARVNYTFKICASRIHHSSEGVAAAVDGIVIEETTGWTISYERNTYMGTEYFSVYAMISDVFGADEHFQWLVSIGPVKENEKLPLRSHRRLLNKVQRTICFPVCYYWKDVKEAMEADEKFAFRVTVAKYEVEGVLSMKVYYPTPATGIINGFTWHDDNNTIDINLDFVRAAMDYEFRIDPKNPTRLSFAPLKHTDVLHFLDHLYHGSKLYTPDLWTYVFSVIQSTKCRKLLRDAQRLMIRNQIIKKEKEGEDKSKAVRLEIMEYYLAHRHIFAIEKYEDYMAAHPEPLIE